MPRLWLATGLWLTLGGCVTHPHGSASVRWDHSPTPAVIPHQPLALLAAEPPSLNSSVTVAAIQTPTDLWERMRPGFALPHIDTPLVRHHEQWYAGQPDYIDRMIDRGSRYLFHIVEEVERRDMPLELALLPIVESAFNPQAVSHAKAAGMWQFMPATGRDFSLTQNAYRDERRDVMASTHAALDYLQRLHRQFGDWHLALAAYNWGAGNVQRAIRTNRAAGKPTGYLDLRMPRETRNYVPKLQAVANLVARPGQYGVALPIVGNHPFFDSVAIDRDMDVALIARLAQIQEADFRALNPSHNKPVIMAAGTPTILLPWDNALVFEAQRQQHQGPTATWTTWRVPRAMRVADAAKAHDMTEQALREVNRIPPHMSLRAGSHILVPRRGALDRDVPVQVADRGRILLVHDGPGTRRVKVQRGDTLGAIARRQGVSVANLIRWNQLRANGLIRVGQVLVIQGRAPAR